MHNTRSSAKRSAGQARELPRIQPGRVVKNKTPSPVLKNPQTEGDGFKVVTHRTSRGAKKVSDKGKGKEAKTLGKSDAVEPGTKHAEYGRTRVARRIAKTHKREDFYMGQIIRVAYHVASTEAGKPKLSKAGSSAKTSVGWVISTYRPMIVLAVSQYYLFAIPVRTSGGKGFSEKMRLDNEGDFIALQQQGDKTPIEKGHYDFVLETTQPTQTGSSIILCDVYRIDMNEAIELCREPVMLTLESTQKMRDLWFQKLNEAVQWAQEARDRQ